MILDLRN